MAGAEGLPDQSARMVALTELKHSLLVEAGAGSGKTSIMAGRVAMLFARGIEPKRIAAITFTEFAASELMIRITRFVAELAKGEIPHDLEHAFPGGVSNEQRGNLERANKSRDQLVCSTIHGFAQALIKPYPVEAGIDPGAEIIDPSEADLAFGEHYEAWLRDHLSGQIDDDIAAELVLANQGGAFGLLQKIADFRRHNRDARPASVPWSTAAIEAFPQAVANFRGRLSRIEFHEADTDATARDFADLAGKVCNSVLRSDRPPNRALIEALNSPRHRTCFTQNGGAKKRLAKGKWVKAAAAAGRPKAESIDAYHAANEGYAACHVAFERLMAGVAGEILARIAAAMEGLLADWRSYKHAAALLDFNDLLYTARDLLARHEQVRQALARRFEHVLVDEFQDTDPLQIEILWRLCGEAQKGGGASPLARALRPGALFLVGDPKQAIYRFRGADVNAYIGARMAIGNEGLLKVTANFRSVEPILSFVNDKFQAVLSTAAGQPGFTELSPTCKAQRAVTAVVALDVADGDDAKADQMRDAEAHRVAELCSRLVGNRLVRDEDGAMRPCRLGDIALLAPVGTQLWRFEEALEDRGVAVSTQAGKGFFHRQEIQDLIALTRTLADGRDTLALGALLRGPLIGLTEAELLIPSTSVTASRGSPFDLSNPWPCEHDPRPLMRSSPTPSAS
jgi:ATP-dependent exoDNAse (exonuclease V) beta subunit